MGFLDWLVSRPADPKENERALVWNFFDVNPADTVARCSQETGVPPAKAKAHYANWLRSQQRTGSERAEIGSAPAQAEPDEIEESKKELKLLQLTKEKQDFLAQMKGEHEKFRKEIEAARLEGELSLKREQARQLQAEIARLTEERDTIHEQCEESCVLDGEDDRDSPESRFVDALTNHIFKPAGPAHDGAVMQSELATQEGGALVLAGGDERTPPQQTSLVQHGFTPPMAPNAVTQQADSILAQLTPAQKAGIKSAGKERAAQIARQNNIPPDVAEVVWSKL